MDLPAKAVSTSCSKILVADTTVPSTVLHMSFLHLAFRDTNSENMHVAYLRDPRYEFTHFPKIILKTKRVYYMSRPFHKDL